MEAFISDKLRLALEADELGELDKIIQARDHKNLVSLQKILSTDAQDISNQFRTRALYALGRWKEPEVVKDIVRLLPELDESARITAIDALGRLGTEQALDVIPAFSNDPSPHVRKVVIQALSRIGHPTALTKLRTIANKDSVKWIRVMAVNQLKKHAK